MEWTNPIVYPQEIEEGRGFRDPFILKDGGWWYLTGTMYPHFEGDKGSEERTKGVPLYKTQDFKSWVFVDIILERPSPAEKKWYQNYFWAPEIFLHNGKYYLTVNCSEKGHYENLGNKSLQGVCLAVADRIEGPYSVITEEKPILYENDAHLFKDTDGKVYLFVSGIQCAEIDLEHGKLVGALRKLASPLQNADAWNAQRPGVGFEGPYVIKKNNTYYLFYSTWARGYEIGIAECKNTTPLRQWSMQENPFYGAMNRENCAHYGADYVDGYYAYNYRESGHNSIFLGPDGNDWIAAHVFENGNQDAQIKLVLDRLYYDGNTFYVCDQNGTRVNGPTHGRQSVDLGSPVQSPVNKALDTWAWCRRGESFQMPEQADLLFANGWRESCDVVWNGLVDTAKPGKQVVDGTVLHNGAPYLCQITVIVEK